jgi:hypothetical protein
VALCHAVERDSETIQPSVNRRSDEVVFRVSAASLNQTTHSERSDLFHQQWPVRA